MLKNFLIKKMIKSQMKGVSDAEVDKFLAIIEKNPELFQKIAVEIKQKTDSGENQMNATMAVMGKYQDELKKIT